MLKDWIVHKKDSELYNFKHTCTQTARTEEKYKLKKRERAKEEKYYCTPMTLMDLKWKKSRERKNGENG